MPMVVERWRIGSEAPLVIPFYAVGSLLLGWTLPLRLMPLQPVPLRLGPLGWAVPLRLMPGLGPLQWPKVLILAMVVSGSVICNGGQNNPDE